MDFMGHLAAGMGAEVGLIDTSFRAAQHISSKTKQMQEIARGIYTWKREISFFFGHYG